MHFVVAGPMSTMLAAAHIPMVTIGVKTLYLFFASKNPDMPEAVRGPPGYVTAMATGNAVCIAKYIGKSFDCKVANWGRGKALKDTIPAMKLLKT